MTSQSIITFSAAAEPWIAVALGGALLGLAAWAVLARRRSHGARASLDDPIAPWTEGVLVVLVVAVSLATRLVGWDDALTPPFWFSQVPTLHVARLLGEGTLWPTWLGLFRTTQVGWAHESVVLLPAMAALQHWLGPRFGLPVLAGAVLGTLAVVLAWMLGRRMRSQAFGVAFAAFVAASPLQLTWARLGPYYIAAVPHVLFALLAGWVAGQRASPLLAAAAGLVSWANLYAYYPARVGIPLGALAMMAGTSRWTSASRRLLLLVAWAIAFAAAGWALAPGSVAHTFWPAYGGYAGNRGEQSIGEFVGRNLANFVEQAWVAPERYFLHMRAIPSIGYEAGMDRGGLSLMPTAILGLVGALVVAARFRTQWLWAVVAAAGFSLPIVSVTTARRLLVFDLAWCALAAHGLLSVIDVLAGTCTRRTRAVLVGVALGALTAWGSVAVFALSVALPAGSQQPIPFGEAGFGDGTTCKRCLEVAKEWQRDIAAGAFVVLFDNDQARENRTSPGGLEVYGKIAAAVAGHPDAFVEAYGVMGNWDGEAPKPGAVFEPNSRDFATYLAERIERAAPERIIWHFERPTLWERWLGRRLAEPGGAVESFATPLSPTPGIRVVTSWDARERAVAVLRDLATGWWPADDTPCVDLVNRETFAMNGPVLLLAAAAGSGATSPPVWLGASWVDVRLGPHRFEFPTPLGALVPSAPGDKLELYGEFGRRVVVDPASGEVTPLQQVPSGNPGLNCAVHAGGRWWTVDPMQGVAAPIDATTPALTGGGWIGAARGAGDTLILASADQSLAEVDARTGQIRRRFPARVSPSVRIGRDECSQIAVGDGWIATVDLRTAIASFYDRDGRALGTKCLDPVRQTLVFPTAFVGAGRYLGVGWNGGNVRTYEVSVQPDCVPPSAGAPAE